MKLKKIFILFGAVLLASFVVHIYCAVSLFLLGQDWRTLLLPFLGALFTGVLVITFCDFITRMKA